MRENSTPSKKPFAEPKLVVYGDFLALTRTQGNRNPGDNAVKDNNMRT